VSQVLLGQIWLDFLIHNTHWSITGIDNLSTGNKDNITQHVSNPRFTFIEQSCSQIKSIKTYDIIFHLAALPRIQPSFEYIKEHVIANVLEGVHLIELMIKESIYPRFIYSGSSAIYGTPKQIPTPETEPIDCLRPMHFKI
jgi:UDP-glucose 4-epimerase